MRARTYTALLAEMRLRREIDAEQCRLRFGVTSHVAECPTSHPFVERIEMAGEIILDQAKMRKIESRRPQRAHSCDRFQPRFDV